jgi:transposase
MASQMRDAGMSLRAIAKKLGVSEGTVRNDLRKCETSAKFMAPRCPKLRTKSAQIADVIPFMRSS